MPRADTSFFAPQRVRGVFYDANEQSLFAELADSAEEALLLHRTHERHTPNALDAIAAALDGRFGALRHVAGTLNWHNGVARIEPWALVCDHIVIPDFAAHSGALPAVLLGPAEDGVADDCAVLLERLRQHLAAAIHHGVRRLPQRWRQEGEQLARQLFATGFQQLSQGLMTLHVTLASEDLRTATAARLFMNLASMSRLHLDAMERQRGATEQK